MNFIPHPSNTRVLYAPANNASPGCRDLPLTDTTMNGAPAVASFWMPLPEELALLNQGKPVILMVAGQTHPPLFITVEGENPEIPQPSAWAMFLSARTNLLREWAAEGRDLERMATEAGLQGADHVRRILETTK